MPNKLDIDIVLDFIRILCKYNPNAEVLMSFHLDETNVLLGTQIGSDYLRNAITHLTHAVLINQPTNQSINE